MKLKLILLTIILSATANSFAQQLGIGECGIVCTYDAAGNRLKRLYFCNNGIDPYPTKAQKVTAYVETPAEKPTNQTTTYQLVDALYPNPTTGKFSVTFSKNLSNAQVCVLDNSGKAIARFTAGGNRVNFDLSSYPAGMYYIMVQEGESVVTKKVIKQ